MRINTCLGAICGALLFAGAALAQDQKSTTSSSKSQQNPFLNVYVNNVYVNPLTAGQTQMKPAKVLELQLENALKRHPDILVAEARVREAEAELNRIRQQVMAKIAMLQADMAATKMISEEGKSRLDDLLRLQAHRKELVTSQEMSDARASVLRYQGDLERLNAQLPHLLGAAGAKTGTTPSGQDMFAQAKKQNADILTAEARVGLMEAELNRARHQVAAKIRETQAEVGALERILEEAKTRLMDLQRLDPGAKSLVTRQEMSDARAAVARYTGDLESKKQMLLAVLGGLGQSAPGSQPKAPPNSDAMTTKIYHVAKAEAEAFKKFLSDYFAHSPESKIVWNVKGGFEPNKEHIELHAPASVHREVASLTENSPPILKTYVVGLGHAENLAKVLLEFYKATETIRITAIGNTQVMVYAPPVVHAEIAKYHKVAAALAPPKFKGPDGGNPTITASFYSQDKPATQIAKALSDKFREPDEIAALSIGVDDQTNALVVSGSPASLKKVEDYLNIRFIIRNHGVIGVEANRIPEGAMLLRDFANTGPAKDDQTKK